MGKKALITGITGQDGSYLAEFLLKKGYKAKIFDVTNYLCWGTPNDYKTYNYWYEYFK